MERNMEPPVDRLVCIDDDFATLFAQLDRPAMSAPMDDGLHRLMRSIAAIKLAEPAPR